jgi:histidinol phosphatase-like PHP family hydrolase
MTLADLHRVLQARGDAYAFLTDHARDCAVAGGLFAGDFEAERREIDRLNARTERGFTMFLGAESNIAEDGTLDVTPKRVPCLDAVIASVHTNLRDPRDQTPRLMRALEQPGVAVLGHPRGGSQMRSGIGPTGPACSRGLAMGIAIRQQLPQRLDLNPVSRDRRRSGCLFSLSSDAHAPASGFPAVRSRRRAARRNTGREHREHMAHGPLRGLARGATGGLKLGAALDKSILVDMLCV